jgi:hypothetical protein
MYIWMQEVENYLQRFEYEWKILNFINTEFSTKTENKKGDEENLTVSLYVNK